jgi:hypothetical protein
MKKKAVLSLIVFLAMMGAGTAYRAVKASDHDDGENDSKARSLNLTDVYTWKDTSASPTAIDFIQAVNPRSLPGYQYFHSSNALYDIHVSRVTDKTAVPTGSDDIVFRFQFSAPNSSNVQTVTMTVIHSGATVGSDAGGTTTPIGSTASPYTATIGGIGYKYVVGTFQDTFSFDVQRFFQVRNFLASTFFGGVVATTPLNTFQVHDATCDNNYFLKNVTGYDTTGGTGTGTASTDNGDPVHLFNPPACAPDFTRHYNRLEIELQVPLTALQSNSETVFDTWSTIEIPL